MEEYLQSQQPQAQFSTSLAPTIRCFHHGKICSMVCGYKDCDNKTLCTECIITHPKNHLAKILPLKEFDQNSNHVPKMIARDLDLIRQRMSVLSNNITSQREAKKSEVRRTMQQAIDIFKTSADQYARELYNEIDAFYAKPQNLLNEVVLNCNNHLEQLNPYIRDGGDQGDSRRFDFFLAYQEKLLNAIVPQLASQSEKNSKEVMSKSIDITGQHFLNSLTSLLKRVMVNQTMMNPISQDAEYDTVMDSLETFKSKKIDEYKPKPRGNQFYKDQLQPYFHKHQDIIYSEYKVPQSSDFNQFIKDQRIGSSQSQKVIPKHKESSIPYEIFIGYQKNLNILIKAHDDIITCICIISLSQIASGCGDGSIKVWNIDNQMNIGKLSGHVGEVWDLVPLRDPMEGTIKSLASCGRDKLIKVWSLAKNTCLFTLVGHLDVVRCLIYLPEKNYLASGGIDYKIKIWSLETEKQILSFDEAHIKLIKALEHVEQKDLLLSGSGDGILKVWSISKGYRRDEMAHGAEINVIKRLDDFREGVTMVATAGSDRKIVIWNIDSSVQVKTLYGHHDSILSLDFSNKNNVLVSGGVDKTIRLWDPEKLVMTKSIKAHSDQISCLRIHEDRKLIITGGWDRVIRIVSIDYLMSKEKNL